MGLQLIFKNIKSNCLNGLRIKLNPQNNSLFFLYFIIGVNNFICLINLTPKFLNKLKGLINFNSSNNLNSTPNPDDL